MVNTKQKLTVDSPKDEEKVFCHRKSLNQRKTVREKARNKVPTKKPEHNKMSIINCYLLIITLNINGLIVQSESIVHLIGGEKKRPNYMLPIERLTLVIRTHIN